MHEWKIMRNNIVIHSSFSRYLSHMEGKKLYLRVYLNVHLFISHSYNMCEKDLFMPKNIFYSYSRRSYTKKYTGHSAGSYSTSTHT